MRKVLLLATIATVAAFGFAVFMPGASADAEPKVIVCKYVANENAPGGEVFGQVIDVSANALDGFDPNLPFPQTFTDAQGKSVAVRYATGPGDKGDPVTDCGQPPETTTPPPCPNGTTTITVTHTETVTAAAAASVEDEDCTVTQTVTVTKTVSEPPETTTPPPVTTTPPPVGGGGPPACPGSVHLGPWYGDPRINIDLTGAGTFVVSGGIQRFTGLTTITKTLACHETFRIGRYKVSRGHFLNISMDGVRIVHVKPPVLH